MEQPSRGAAAADGPGAVDENARTGKHCRLYLPAKLERLSEAGESTTGTAALLSQYLRPLRCLDLTPRPDLDLLDLY